MSHTPGPWRTRGTNFDYTDRDILGPPHPDGGDYAPIATARTSEDARLMAGAPQLLEALKGFVEEWDDLALNQLAPAYTAAIAAIAKVEGRS